MADNRKKASMSQVLADIKPYITKKFMAVPCIKEQDIQTICQILLPRYKNVQLMQGLTNNKPDVRIQVKGLFGTEEKRSYSRSPRSLVLQALIAHKESTKSGSSKLQLP